MPSASCAAPPKSATAAPTCTTTHNHVTALSSLAAARGQQRARAHHDRGVFGARGGDDAAEGLRRAVEALPRREWADRTEAGAHLPHAPL